MENLRTKNLKAEQLFGISEQLKSAFCVSTPTPQKRRSPKHIITPEIHKAIFELYAKDQEEFSELVKKIVLYYKIPRWKITKYAIYQGWIKRARPQTSWTDAEVKILERNAHFAPETIQRKLKKAGYTRTCTGIQVKRKRLRMLQNLNGQSANSVAYCLGIAVGGVLRYIKNGKLKATRREYDKERPDFYIKDKDIKRFIVNNVDAIDFRKVDKHWLVDLLTNTKTDD